MSPGLVQTGAAILAALIAWGVFQLRAYLSAGAGYRAKVLCTGIFGSRRSLDRQLLEQVSADSYWLLRPFRARVDHARRSVTASFCGLRERTAIHRDGLGATLLCNAPLNRLGAGPLLRTSAPHAWVAEPGREGLRRLVHAAFDDPHPRRRRRTYAVVVVHDGRIVAEQYAPGIAADTPMPGWSMAKSVLNALTGILIGDGRLALDQRELLPQWRSPDPRAAISIEDLLRMRSGLRFSETYGNPWSDVVHMLYGCHDVAGYAASLPLVAPAGTAWSYSSGTTNILSSLIRNAVGDAEYADWPRRALFEPLGMNSAVLEPDGSGTFVCSSYMLATARDWARFGQLFLDQGRAQARQILSDEWIRFSTTPTPQSPDGRYGAHWWLKLGPEIGGDTPAARTLPPDAFFAIGHEGQTLSIIPSKRLVVVRLGASIYIDAWDQAGFLAGIQAAL